jgi:hypothetical protein
MAIRIPRSLILVVAILVFGVQGYLSVEFETAWRQLSGQFLGPVEHVRKVTIVKTDKLEEHNTTNYEITVSTAWPTTSPHRIIRQEWGVVPRELLSSALRHRTLPRLLLRRLSANQA